VLGAVLVTRAGLCRSKRGRGRTILFESVRDHRARSRSSFGAWVMILTDETSDALAGVVDPATSAGLVSDSAVLCNALVALARGDLSKLERDRHAAVLVCQLRIVAGMLVRGKFRNLCRISDPDELLRDAVQHTAVAACTGHSRFRGCSPPQAVSWCTKVLSNFILAELRDNRLLCDGDAQLSELPAVGDANDPSFVVTVRDAVRACMRVIRGHSVTECQCQAVCCYLEQVAGVPIDGQLECWAASANTPSAAVERRARNRLYQYRHRGRALLREVIDIHDR